MCVTLNTAITFFRFSIYQSNQMYVTLIAITLLEQGYRFALFVADVHMHQVIHKSLNFVSSLVHSILTKFCNTFDSDTHSSTSISAST